MFKVAKVLFINTETPLHSGAGQALGAVDLPVQRERTTNYPIVQASSVKGKLRAETEEHLEKDEYLTIFGPEGENASEHAGALSVGDANILLFPVRSLAGVSAWVTSFDVLARFRRFAALANLHLEWKLPKEPAENEAVIYGDELIAGDKVVLEEFSFEPKKSDDLKIIGEWLASIALLQTDEYAYWRKVLPLKLCLLHDDTFRDFVLYSTEVQTHICLDPTTKTVKTSALWTTESLPADTLLYAPLLATNSRSKKTKLSGEQILEKIAKVISENLSRTQLGGNVTTGQGIVALRVAGGENS